jgi:2-polyprenyl-3-methyl-5-hydroxy-6-metoxy-1,4-benzoquinol methylase
MTDRLQLLTDTNLTSDEDGQTETSLSAPRCFYCGSGDLVRTHTGKFHKLKSDHGPFDIYRCGNCGSGLTLPPPRPEQIAELYKAHEFGMSSLSRQLISDNSEAAWHSMCAKRIASLYPGDGKSAFAWIDVGAGGGEMARVMTRQFPASRGIALDIHDRPPTLAGVDNVKWQQLDITSDDFAGAINRRADIVFATGVWEHVRRPDIFARNAVSLVKPGGLLYMTTPNYGSLARRIFGTSWPYFNPGEHLCMPTPKGARLCLSREIDRAFGGSQSAKIWARPILVRYGLRFALTKLGMPRLGRALPPRLAAFVPSGAMETIAQLAG